MKAHRYGAGAAPPATLERAQAESTLSLLTFDHNTMETLGFTFDADTESARAQVQALLEEIAMTATGLLHAEGPRPELLASAQADAGKLATIADAARAHATGPLAVSVAAALERAASNVRDLVAKLARLPGTTPLPTPPPVASAEPSTPPATSSSSHPHAHAELADGEEPTDDETPRAPRRSSVVVAVVAAAAAVGVFLLPKH